LCNARAKKFQGKSSESCCTWDGSVQNDDKETLMLGRNHAAFGALVGLGVGAIAGPVGAVAGALVGGGASLLPDLDEPESSVSRSLGPITEVLSRVVARVSGGHRNATHSPVGVAIASAIAGAIWFAVPDGIGRAVLVGLAAALFLRALMTEAHLPRRLRRIAEVIVGVGIGFFAARAGVPVEVFWAGAAGYAMHIGCDAITNSGVPLLWPVRKTHFGVGLFKTGSRPEAVLGLMVWILLGVASYALLHDQGPALSAAISHSSTNLSGVALRRTDWRTTRWPN